MKLERVITAVRCGALGVAVRGDPTVTGDALIAVRGDAVDG